MINLLRSVWKSAALIGAAPRSAVRRERPAAGDIVVLLGGKPVVTAAAVQPVPLRSTPLTPS